jgi:hypothetical protein
MTLGEPALPPLAVLPPVVALPPLLLAPAMLAVLPALLLPEPALDMGWRSPSPEPPQAAKYEIESPSAPNSRIDVAFRMSWLVPFSAPDRQRVEKIGSSD